MFGKCLWEMEGEVVKVCTSLGWSKPLLPVFCDLTFFKHYKKSKNVDRHRHIAQNVLGLVKSWHCLISNTRVRFVCTIVWQMRQDICRGRNTVNAAQATFIPNQLLWMFGATSIWGLQSYPTFPCQGNPQVRSQVFLYLEEASKCFSTTGCIMCSICMAASALECWRAWAP